MGPKTTISVIKCDVGSLAGHHTVPRPLLKIGEKRLGEAQKEGLINSYSVFHAGDDLELLMVHNQGEEDREIHKLAWDTFKEAAKKAAALKLYGAGQDILKTAFSGNVRGMGPGVAEMEIAERKSDPIVVFAADKTEPGAFNYPLFRIFADPTNTAGLVIDPQLAGGFEFEASSQLWIDYKSSRICGVGEYTEYGIVKGARFSLISSKDNYRIRLSLRDFHLSHARTHSTNISTEGRL